MMPVSLSHNPPNHPLTTDATPQYTTPDTAPLVAQEPTASATTTTTITDTKKRKRKEKPHILHSATFKKPAWTYFHLRLITAGTATPTSKHPLTVSQNAQATTTTTTMTSTAASELDDGVAESADETKNQDTTSSHLLSAPGTNIEPEGTGAETEPHDSPPDLDPLSAIYLLQPALSSFLGLTGSSIPIDILRTKERDVWIRVPRLDARALRASLAGWVGSCDKAILPLGEQEGAKARVAWRVVDEAVCLLAVVGANGDGHEDAERNLFGT